VVAGGREALVPRPTPPSGASPSLYTNAAQMAVRRDSKIHFRAAPGALSSP